MVILNTHLFPKVIKHTIPSSLPCSFSMFRCLQATVQPAKQSCDACEQGWELDEATRTCKQG